MRRRDRESVNETGTVFSVQMGHQNNRQPAVMVDQLPQAALRGMKIGKDQAGVS